METASLVLIVLFLLGMYGIHKYLRIFYNEIVKHYRFIQFYRRKDLFTKNYHEEMEYLLRRATLRCIPLRFITIIIMRMVLLKKWKIYVHSSVNKPVGRIAFGSSKILRLEKSAYIRNKIISYIVERKDDLIPEFSSFMNFDKGYVLETFLQLIPEDSKTIPFVNCINEIIYTNALAFAFKNKRISEPVLRILDIGQQQRYKQFAA